MIINELKRGIIDENPILVMALGLCSALATSASLFNAIGMGVATTFVLMCSNVIISVIKGFIPDKIRIPCYIVVIATFVSIVEILMRAWFPLIYKQLGIFVPLIVVNCIILARAEAFASKNNILTSLVDGIAVGTGFIFTLVILGFIRELFGSNKLFGFKCIPGFKPVTIFLLAPGGFFTIAFIMSIKNYLSKDQETEKK